MKIPSHLERFSWYSPHLAWLRHAGFNTEHEPLPGNAPQRANLGCADLRGVNLTDADLRGAYLGGADLTRADLTEAILRGANLPFDAEIPVIENIDRKILDAVTAAGCSLDMSRWHTCATTHCRAGWAIHLAGEPGRRLEQRYGSGVAGSLIYAKSRPDKPVPDFYATNEAAMADIVKCAAEGGAA